jgi:hypothetical protein
MQLLAMTFLREGFNHDTVAHSLRSLTQKD